MSEPDSAASKEMTAGIADTGRSAAGKQGARGAVLERVARACRGIIVGEDTPGWTRMCPSMPSATTIQSESPEGQDPLTEGILATLESIRRKIEEGAGKVQTPRSGVEPDTGENPAVVRDDPPSGAPGS